MITSCSPGWIKHIEHQFPTGLDHLSTCKSPHTMMGAVVKSFYAERTGGCINGGGQPRCHEEGYREKRSHALYSEDERKSMRKSHENPDLMKLYEDYLGAPGGHLSHKLHHTTYTPRGRYNELV